jgi:hypothetical protein
MYIIVKGSRPRGRTRTSTDKELKDAGWGSSFRDSESADKCAFVERKLKEKYNMNDSRVTAKVINEIQ